MRRHRLFQAAAGLTFLPAIACAAVYDFKSTEVSALGDPTFSFVLDTSSAVSANNSTSFPGVTIDESGTKVFGNTMTLVSPTELASPLFFFIDTDLPGPKAFGDGSGPTIKFNVGSFTIADGFTDGEGTLSIAEAPASAAPEPGTWLLMLAGVGGIGSMLRRSRVRRTSAAVSPARRAGC